MIEIESVEGAVSVESDGAPVWISEVRGPVTVVGEDGPIEVSEAVGPVTVEARIAPVTLRRIAREARVRADHGAVLALAVAGRLDIRAETATVEVRSAGSGVDIAQTDGILLLDRVAGPVAVAGGRGEVLASGLAGPATIAADAGAITVRGFRGPLEVDGGGRRPRGGGGDSQWRNLPDYRGRGCAALHPARRFLHPPRPERRRRSHQRFRSGAGARRRDGGLGRFGGRRIPAGGGFDRERRCGDPKRRRTLPGALVTRAPGGPAPGFPGVPPLLLLIALGAASSACYRQVEETSVETLSRPGAGTLVVRLDRGSLSISEHAGSTMEIEIRRSARALSPAAAQSALETLIVEAEEDESAGALVVRGRIAAAGVWRPGERGALRLRIRVPEGAAVDARTASGRIELPRPQRPRSGHDPPTGGSAPSPSVLPPGKTPSRSGSARGRGRIEGEDLEGPGARRDRRRKDPARRPAP